MDLTKEQQQILECTGKRVVVSASAGSGKTFVLVEKLISLICEKSIPVSRLLVLTFTKAAAQEMKSRLLMSLLAQKPNEYILQQIDDLSISDISTIDSFCEKIIKRNISKLDIDEGFTILDERGIYSLRKRAFQSAFEKFSANEEDFNQLYFAFKKNKDRLSECIFEMQSFFDSIANEKQLRQDFLENYNTYQESAKRHIKDTVLRKVKEAIQCLERAKEFCEIPQKPMAFVEDLLAQVKGIDLQDEFYPLCKNLSLIITPDLPRGKLDKDFKKLIAKGKNLIKESQDITDYYKNLSEEEISGMENGSLAKALIRFYNLYVQRYALFKNRRGVLDFADIERHAFSLLQDAEIKKTLQEKYDYIFIDEYQDTNRLQECILKPIAEGGYFTAVGDIKQGIYGFRNASKEIMLQDIADFEKAEDGEALFLTGNFRTDEKILSFVNDIFVKIMTLESAGIDYKDRSQLVGLQKFETDGLPAVSVDIVYTDKPREKKIREGIYSVEKDELREEDKFSLELATIESRINEVLAGQIYDAKNKVFREVKQNDIALLFRNRSPLMKECVRYLQSKGFAVEADIKNSLLDDGQIRLICALLKLTLSFQDDISLASVMASPIGEFSLQELADIRKSCEKEDFNQIILNSANKKVINFLQRIKEFSFDCQVFGITKALQKLFNMCGYYDYLKTFKDYREKIGHINDLFKLIKETACDFKVSSLISVLEQNTKQKTSQDGSVDAINVTTIHATKGLEYPVVILCGCGESLNKVYNKNYILSEKYGLGTIFYNFEKDSQMPSPMFVANKMKKQQDEFEAELMVFYVALTRAQNHLYIIGSGKGKNFTFDEIEEQSSYLKFIMYALGESFTTQLFEQGQIDTTNRRFQIVSEVEENECEIFNKIKDIEKTKKNQEKIKKYQEFLYENKNYCKINYKNSVTGILKLEEDELFEKENKLSFQENSIKNSSLAIQTGNAYHEALKLINLSQINSLEKFEEEFEKIIPLLQEGYLQLINKNILYKNINIINGLIKNQTIFKEQEFIMKTSLSEIGLGKDMDKEFVIVQGIVDFFAVGEKNILIDFKYTSADENTIINRYKKQIELYSKAIEMAFKIKLDERYLLSLKNSKLIKI